VALELGLISRELFIEIWLGLWALMGIYMLGYMKLSHDTETERNIYGQEYTSLSRMFIAMGAFIFAVYLLPGIWGAPLHGVSGFLPH
jgi:thiol:disulfide interchange protein DsbD